MPTIQNKTKQKIKTQSTFIRLAFQLVVLGFFIVIYTLFDGLAYNTCGYSASCVVFFRAPQGRG